MAYACGNCYPQWKVDSAFAMQNGLNELVDKDIYVVRNMMAIEDILTDSVSNCMICYDFYFTGSFKKTLSGKYKFDVDSFNMELGFPNCCN